MKIARDGYRSIIYLELKGGHVLKVKEFGLPIKGNKLEYLCNFEVPKSQLPKVEQILSDNGIKFNSYRSSQPEALINITNLPEIKEKAKTVDWAYFLPYHNHLPGFHSH